MARTNNGNSGLKYLAAAVAVVAVAFCAGYYVIGGGRSAAPSAPESIVAQTPEAPPAPAPVKTVEVAMKPRSKNSDYTAPDAPRIQIVEERAPSLTDTSKLQPKPAGQTIPSSTDAEASQTGALPTPKTAAVTTPDTSLDTTPSPAPDTDTTTASTPPADDSASAAPPVDPDVEQVGSGGNGNSDAEAGQEGNGGGKAQYRVQTGSFVTADNARALADALRRRGYNTSTHSEQDGGKTVYRVQIGAYRNKAAADKAAQDLQSNGYPAYVSPLSQ